MARKILESLVDKDNIDKSAGPAFIAVGSVFIANIISNLVFHRNLDETGLMKHLYAGVVMGGLLSRATEGIKTIPRILGIGAITSAFNFGWEYFENHGHLYGTVMDSKIDSFSDLASVYLGSALGAIKGWMDKKYERRVKNEAE